MFARGNSNQSWGLFEDYRDILETQANDWDLNPGQLTSRVKHGATVVAETPGGKPQYHP